MSRWEAFADKEFAIIWFRVLYIDDERGIQRVNPDPPGGRWHGPEDVLKFDLLAEQERRGLSSETLIDLAR